jgi:hypothetical protein
VGTLMVVCIAGLVAGSSAATQSGPLSVGPGDRVRIRLQSSSHQLVANVLSVDEDGLTVTADDAAKPVSLSWKSVRRVELSSGIRSRAGDGAVLGAVVLGGLPAVVCALASGQDDGTCALFAAASVAAGAGIGALVFSGSTTDQWVEVRGRRVSVGGTPLRRGAALRLAVRF